MNNDHRVLIYSDAHVERHGGSEARLNEALQALEWVYDVALENEIMNVIFLGDMFHNRARVDVQAYHGAYSIIKRANEAGIQTYFVVGNHDMFYKDRRDINSIAPFESLGRVIDEPCQLAVAGHKIDFLPYVEDKIYLELSKCFPNPSNVLMGHVAVEGAVLNTKSKTAATFASCDDSESVEDGSGVALVSAQSLASCGWKRIYLGHYHAAQVVREDDPRIEYVGSPLQLSFGEAFDSKRIVILDLQTLKAQDVFNTFSPQFMIFDVDENTEQAEISKHVKNARVRLRVQGGIDPNLAMDLRRQISKGGAISCEKRSSTTTCKSNLLSLTKGAVTESSDSAEQRVDLHKLINDPHLLFKRYTEGAFLNDADALGISQDDLYKFGTQVYDESRSKSDKIKLADTGHKKVVIHKVQACNFLSVGNDPVVVPIGDLDPLVLVRGFNLDLEDDGNNGCGKSAIMLEAICFALYGETLRKLQKSEIVNDITGKKCEVKVWVNDVVVTRSLKPDKLQVEMASGEDKTLGSKAETEKWLIQHLGLSWEAFSYLVAYDSETMMSFITTPESKRRELIENILSLDLTPCLDLVRGEEHKKKVKKEADQSQAKVETLSDEVERLKVGRDEQRALLTRFNDDIKQGEQLLKEQLSTLTIDSKSVLKDIELEEENDKRESVFRAETSQLQQRYDRARSLVSGFEDDVCAGEKQLSNVQEKLRYGVTVQDIDDALAKEKEAQLREVDLNEKISGVEKRANKTQAQLDMAKKELVGIVTQIESVSCREEGAICPTCKVPATSENIAHVLAELEKVADGAQIVYDDTSKALEAVNVELDKLNSEKRDLASRTKPIWLNQAQSIKAALEMQGSIETNLSSAIKKLEAAKKDLEEIDLKLQFNKQQLVKLGARTRPSITRKQVEEQESLRASLNQKIESLKEKKKNNPHATMVKDYEKRIIEAESKIAQLKDVISSCSRRSAIIAYWEEAFSSGIRGLVISEIIDAVNQEVSKWLNATLGGDVELQFNTDLEAFITMITTGCVSSFRKLSAGEKRRINIATLLAFSQVMQAVLGVEVNYIVFDEPVDKLDHQGIMGAVSAFIELSKFDKHVVVITHHPLLVSELSSVAQNISVTKEMGFTRVEIGSSCSVDS